MEKVYDTDTTEESIEVKLDSVNLGGDVSFDDDYEEESSSKRKPQRVNKGVSKSLAPIRHNSYSYGCLLILQQFIKISFQGMSGISMPRNNQKQCHNYSELP